MFSIALDRQITRRKFYHILCDPAGTVIFRSKRLSDLVEVLRTLDQIECRLDCPDGRSVIMRLRADQQKET